MPYEAFAVIFLAHLVSTATILNEYIRHYEPLSYNSEHLHRNHLRAKRTPGNPFVDLNFAAHGRSFHLRMKRDTSVFAPDLQIDGGGGEPLAVDTSHLYEGTVWGEPDTLVYGSVVNGVFDGKIHTPRGTFYVERIHKYFDVEKRKSLPKDYHSVIYHERDVVDPYEKFRKGHAPGCGITPEVEARMNVLQNSAQPVTTNQNEVIETAQSDNSIHDEGDQNQNSIYDLSNFGWRSNNRLVAGDFVDNELMINGLADENFDGLRHHWTRHQRSHVKRTEDGRPKLRNKRAYRLLKRACSLYIQTDPLLWEHIHRQESDDQTKTREEITSLVAQHVKAVNVIYEYTDFNEYRGIKFVVQRITINDTDSCMADRGRQPNPFCSQNIDVSNFLNLNSQMNHDDFCLAYVFTYRDFSGGTLGLAWVASPQGASGGICEKYKSYTENVGGRHIQTKRSLNTGIITFVNYNSRVPPKVSQLTLAHEIGHNFGSPHDWPLECRPGGPEGNYIMFASATSGDRLNNNKFSKCSVANVSAVLHSIFTSAGGKNNCFQEDEGPFCGNKIVEQGEECDCGYDDRECTEHCCYPKLLSTRDRALNSRAKPCMRREGTDCSPSEGPCCNSSCRFEGPKVCRYESDCTLPSSCSGLSAKCPTPAPKQNRTECNENTQVCLNGECIGSICIKFNMEECFMTKKDYPQARPEQLCEVACQQPGKPDTCHSTYEVTPQIAAKYNAAIYMDKDVTANRKSNLSSGIKLRPGSPCDNFQGYCDVFQKCRAVDVEGPLARLKNLLFNHVTLMTFADRILDNWFAVVLIFVIVVIVMACFIKCCAVHTPSSNPKKPPARRLSETLRRPAETLRRKRRRPPAANPREGEQPPPLPEHNRRGHHHQQHQQPRRHYEREDHLPPAIPLDAPPPPYPGPSRGHRSKHKSGPPRGGYGEGRGHYNRGQLPSAPPQYIQDDSGVRGAVDNLGPGPSREWRQSNPYAEAYLDGPRHQHDKKKKRKG